ncbi:MAG: beta-aspartyl-peptidase, partial [Acidaminococcaceae bacterium]|nr:beta-aspartyl-peptidase [Acidaminococcaceae bacterium]
MIKLLKNAEVYAPAFLGKKDVLIANDKICRVDDRIDGYEGLPDVEAFDLEGKKLLPGYIDMHVHICGGGGEQGFSSRVPASRLSIF